MSPHQDAEALVPAVEGLLLALVRRRLGDQEPSTLTTTQQLALACVVDEGPLRLGALARKIGTTDPTACRAVDVLEDAGLAQRRPEPSDGRGVTITSTPAGDHAIAEARSGLVVMLTRLLETMDLDSRAIFGEIMHGLQSLLEDADQAASDVATTPDVAQTVRGEGDPVHPR